MAHLYDASPHFDPSVATGCVGKRLLMVALSGPVHCQTANDRIREFSHVTVRDASRTVANIIRIALQTSGMPGYLVKAKKILYNGKDQHRINGSWPCSKDK